MGKSSDGINDIRYGNGHGRMDEGMKVSPELHEDYRPASEIRREIERTRADMDQTVKEIRDKISPGQLAEHAMDTLQDALKKNGPMIWDAVRRNPMPVAVVAGGIGWLLYAGFGGGGASSSSRRYRTSKLLKATGEPYGDMFEGEGFYTGEGYYAGEPMGGESGSWSGPGQWKSGIAESGSKAWSKAKHAAQSLKETAAEKARSVKETAAEKARSVKDTGAEALKGTAHNVTHGISETAGTVGHQVGGALSSVSHGVGSAVGSISHGVTGAASSVTHRSADLARWTGSAVSQTASQTGQAIKSGYESNPLAMGFLSIVAGCVLGLALPPTQAEVDLMGEQSDMLRERAMRQADKAMNKAMEVGTDAAHKVRETVGAKIEESQDRVLETLHGSETGQSTSGQSTSGQSTSGQSTSGQSSSGQSFGKSSERDFGATEIGKHQQHTQINPERTIKEKKTEEKTIEEGGGTSYHSGF